MVNALTPELFTYGYKGEKLLLSSKTSFLTPVSPLTTQYGLSQSGLHTFPL